MEARNFKEYSVIIESGTGVLFQPMSEDYFYILTAKHNLQNKTEDGYADKPNGTSINIRRFILIANAWTDELIPFTLVKDSNYFPNDNANIDAAILKIQFNDYHRFDISKIHISDETLINKDAYVCGFPNDKRGANNGNFQEQYDNYQIDNNSNDTAFKKSVRLVHIHAQNTVSGMSGGGIIKLSPSFFELIGIQSQMTGTFSDQNVIDFVPISFFNDIIKANSNELELLLPPFMMKFDTLLTEVFKVDDAAPDYKNKIRQAFKKQFALIAINPTDIINCGIKKSLLLKGEETGLLMCKDFWINCLEYLLILSVILEKEITLEDFKSVINTKRLLYSNTESNMGEILPQILNTEFENLENDSSIILSIKKVPPLSDLRKIGKGMIADIYNVSGISADMSIYQAQKITLIKEIIHIKAIEVDCVLQNRETLNKYSLLQIDDLIKNLKTYIDAFFEN